MTFFKFVLAFVAVGFFGLELFLVIRDIRQKHKIKKELEKVQNNKCQVDIKK